MKVLTLTQPWATLVAIGAKRIETRSWRTDYRGPLAIHAAKGFPDDAQRYCTQEPFRTTLMEQTAIRIIWNKRTKESDFPRGVILAVCELKDCRIIGQELNGDATIAADDMISWTPIFGVERAFGNYAPGRYAWLLANIRALPQPVPAKGALGLWDYEGVL